MGKLTVALDVQITPELKSEGISREFVNRIQNLRKDLDFEVTDRIRVVVSGASEEINRACQENMSYIQTEILAESLLFDGQIDTGECIEIGDNQLVVFIEKV